MSDEPALCGDLRTSPAANVVGEGDVVSSERTEVRRALSRDGRRVMAKRYLRSHQRENDSLARDIATREVRLLQLIEQSQAYGGEIAAMRLVEHDCERGWLSFEESAGQPLLKSLASFRRVPPEVIAGGLKASGRWLRAMQTVPFDQCDLTPLDPDYDPPDLQKYCEIRWKRITSWTSRFRNSDLPRRFLDRMTELYGIWRPLPVVWAHGDYCPANVLWDGSTLTAIDYENARPRSPWIDATYFLMMMQSLVINSPWKRFPVDDWRRHFLTGLGVSELPNTPEIRLCMLKHLLCKLGSSSRPRTRSLPERLWVQCFRERVIGWMEAELARPLEGIQDDEACGSP